MRVGTKIQKWFRIKADRIEYMWDSLNKICGTHNLSEKEFEKFVTQCVTQNPDCVAIEDGNCWEKQ